MLSRDVSRADGVLLAIPLALTAAATLSAVPTVSVAESVGFGTAAALAVTGYALFASVPEN